MKENVRRIVSNLQNTNLETIIFEAIMNSIQAVNDFVTLNELIIEDNGKGFTEENINSFSEYRSDYKEKLGSKGISRFFFLKLFKDIEINSLNKIIFFSENNELTIKSSKNNSSSTKIIFKNNKKEIKVEIGKLRQQIFNYFTPLFFLNKKNNQSPILISIFENNNKNPISVINSNEIYNFEEESFTLKNKLFNIYYLYDKFKEDSKIYFCANE